MIDAIRTDSAKHVSDNCEWLFVYVVCGRSPPTRCIACLPKHGFATRTQIRKYRRRTGNPTADAIRANAPKTMLVTVEKTQQLDMKLRRISQLWKRLRQVKQMQFYALGVVRI